MKLNKLAEFHSTITFTDARGNCETYRVIDNAPYNIEDLVDIIDARSDIELKMYPLANSGKSVKKLLKECNNLELEYLEGISSLR